MGAHVVRGEGFSVEFRLLPGYLRAYVFDGIDSVEVSSAYHRLVGAECERLGMRNVLIVEDLVDDQPIDDIETIAQAAIEAGFERLRVAFVELRGRDVDNLRGQEVGLTHGIVIMVFSSEDQARSWLLYGDEGEERAPHHA